MTHTYHQLLYHLIWSTKERKSVIRKEYHDRFFPYLGGIFRSLECAPIQIGGMPDHVHALVSIPPRISISEIVRNSKVSSSKWLKDNYPELDSFSWQEGYGAFTVSSSSEQAVIQYIQNQENHHRERDFREEFLGLLKKHRVSFDEKYLWK
jgi:putative transposase